MAKTYIGASSPGTTTANTTNYWRLGGIVNANTTETNRQSLLRSAGDLSNLYVRVTANTIAGSSTVTLRKNATTDTAVTLSIGSSATGEFTDAVNTVASAAGDKWTYKFVPGAATNTMTFSLMSCIFSATTDTVTRTHTTDNISKTTASTTWFIPLSGAIGTDSTTETNAKSRMRKAGTLKNGCAHVTAARATASTVRSRKNAANGNLNISCTAGTTGFFEDTVNSDTVSAGEDWNWSITTGTGADTLTIQEYLGDFVSTASVGFVEASDLVTIAYADAATRYTQISGRHTSVTTEADTKADCRLAAKYSELTCLVTQNDVSSASTVTLRKNGADTTLIASITGSTTGVFSDSTHTETLVSTDEVNYEITIPSVSGAHTCSICNILMFTTANAAITVALGTETVTVGESLTRLLAAARDPGTETVVVGESLNRAGSTFNRPLSTETTTISESPALTRSVGRNRALATETVTISESPALARMLAATRALPETTVIGESLNRMLAATRAPATETTTVGENLTRVKGVIRALATETITISEVSLNRMLAATRTLPETTTVGENLTRLLGANRTLSDTVVIGENLQSLKTIVRALATETVVVGESLNRLLAANRALATENTTVGENLTRLLSANRSLATETVVVGESLNRMLAATRALATETVVSGDNLTRLLAASRSLATETVVVGDSLNRMLAAMRVLTTEVVVISDQLDYVYTPGGGGPTNYERTLSDTVVIGESLNRMLAANRALVTEVTAIGENLQRSVGRNRALSDTVVIGENLTRLLAAIRTLSDTTAVTEQLNRMLAATRTLSDTTVIGENLTKLRTVVRALATEVTAIGENLTRRFDGTRTLIETTVITDSLNRLVTLFVIPTQLKSIVSWLRSKYSISTPPKDPSY